MSRIKVLCIVGTRPEAIKMAPVVLELQSRPKEFETVLCSSGQHRELLREALSNFGLIPEIDLDVMTDNQSLSRLFAILLEEIDTTLKDVRPEWVLVQGDTATVAATAIAAHLNRVKLGHIEAGLRSGDKWNPFPEEINRRITTVCADLNFAPTSRSAEALLQEGTLAQDVIVTGNTVVDALRLTLDKSGERSWMDLLGVADLDDPQNQVIVVTLHRRESHGQPLERILAALADVVTHHPTAHIVFPVHPNPNVRDAVYQILGAVPRVHLVNPLPYQVFCQVLAKSHVVLTDSGGVQEEAPSLGIPILIARTTTERPEGVLAGTSILVGTDQDVIRAELEKALKRSACSPDSPSRENPFGDGFAAKRIADGILNWESRGR